MGDEGFDGFFDMEELEEESPFDGIDDDGFLDEFDDGGGDDGGISRAFVIAAALITIAVVIVIGLLLVVALSGNDGPTSREKTATAIVIANENTATAFYATDEALRIIQTATQSYILTAEASATAGFFAQQTQAAQNASATAAAQTAVALTATADFHASQTAEALVAATDAFNADATATKIAVDLENRRLTVMVVDPDGQPIPNVRIRLYRDDGDGEFDPEDRVIGATGGEETGTDAGAPEATDGGNTRPPVQEGANQLTYGSVGEGTLGVGQTFGWVFEGSAGDEISISAEALEATQMDTFLEVFDPNGTRLAGDDDGGDGSNALIEALVLPLDGVYTVEVSSLAGEGDYVLRLFLTIVAPTDEAGDAGTDGEAVTEPTADTSSSYNRPSRTDGIVLVSGGWQDGPTPTPESDALQNALQSTVQGLIDFGSLEPGTYWLEMDYDTLPSVLQALAVPGEPLFVQVVVPEDGPVGDITFRFQPGVTPTPIPTSTDTPAPTETRDPNATQPDIVTETPTPEVTGTITPIVTLEQAGFFEDINDSAGGIEGTSGLTVLVIAAAGLIAVVFIARKLRSAS
jgi:hypothetical protein